MKQPEFQLFSSEVPSRTPRLRGIAEVVLVALAVVVLALSDYGFALSVRSPAWFAGAALLFAAVLASRPGQSLARRICLGMFVLALAVAIRLIEWTPVKPFVRDLHSIQPEMTEAEVDRIMAKYVRGTGWPASSAKGGRGELRFPTTIIFRPTSSPGDSNWGVVTFENGRVGEVDFSPD